ncbi:CocE/NonD family hydrolase [Streptomyces sp. NPDC016309]|uniref:CocE/NonD family hydrolase n=1 Tax=Streptomyces sp. NPDC016309 TaxID=3364965 RepID=UPI00370208F2
MKIRTTFPYETFHEDVRVPLADGTLLYARVWRPLTDEPVPALLEYQPDRLTDWTAPRDAQRHPWYAGHGYASVRVDARGHGNSEGLPHDPWSGAALADGAEVVAWLAARPWCAGRVGMFGIGRGGSLALRLAAGAPGPLRAVVAVCCPDGREEGSGDRHLGGAAVADGSPARAATLLAYAARPPDPRYVGDAWRDMWLTRLEALEPPVPARPAEPEAPDEPAPAPAEPGPGGVDAGPAPAPAEPGPGGVAVLAVGGWSDPYRDTVLRLVERLPAGRVRGIIGPWGHRYPDREGEPGPAIGFLQETLRWWDHHLKDRPTGVMAEPLLRSWISGAGRPGRWVADGAWPSPDVTPVTYALLGPPVLVRSPQQTGLDAGRPVPSGDDSGPPPDQRAEDAHSACFDFPVPPGGAPVEILGRPRVTLALRTDAPTGQVTVRLCDVAPDGSSTLVTRGSLGFSGRPAGPVEVVVDLDGTGYAFAPGHRVRLAVSSAYWPCLWPGPHTAGFTVDPGAGALRLPVRAPGADGPAAAPAFGGPEQAPPLGVTVPATLDETRTRPPARRIVRDVDEGLWRLEDAPRPGGTRAYPDGLEITESALETWTITERDPLSARTRSEWKIRLHRPDLPWNVTVDTRSEVRCDATHFLTSDEVICTEGSEVVFHHTWEKRVARTPG